MITKCQIITDPQIDLSVTLTNGVEQKTFSEPVFDLLIDWQLITITHDGQSAIEIKDLLIDGQSIRENIYTGWYTDAQGKQYNPRNYFSREPAKWSIVVHSDISVLKERLCNQITNGDYGTDLFERYQWFLDLAQPLARSYSSQVDNFFTRSQGINFYPKYDYARHPFVSLNIPIDHDVVYAELVNTNITASTPPHNRWGGKIIELGDYPVLNNWLKNIGIEYVNHVDIRVLYSNGHIELHRDWDRCKEDSGIGVVMKHLHVPIMNSVDSKIKISGGTVMPDCINLFNNESFTHGGVNESDTDRYAVIVNAPITKEFVEKYIIKKNIHSNIEL